MDLFGMNIESSLKMLAALLGGVLSTPKVFAERQRARLVGRTQKA
jgi:hypothetical protein